ncbi:MAG: ABC transporter ATP-binding protein [Anaerohalosphaera sp.]|nr:ABC transporter ATP-binding protein [Anaerohalosphaera sp.]
MESDNNIPVISVKELVKRFGSRLVLDGISIDIEKGKTTAIIGPSGCGKTVLMKHMIALERPTSGSVYFKDHRIDNLSQKQLAGIRANYGFLFQGGALFDSLTVFENIIFPIRQRRKIKNFKEIEELVKSKLALVGLDGFQTQYPANLSGGQKKRVALARAIALDPKVILYDEPTTGLDPLRSDIINELILKLQRELSVTSIVVTHDMNSAFKIADRILMLHEGKIIADGDADYIRSHPDSIVQQFIKGTVGEAELAALRQAGTRTRT